MWTRTNTECQLIQGVLRHGPEILAHCESADDLTQYLQRLDQEHLNYPRPQTHINCADWFVPQSYQHMDMEAFLLTASPQSNHRRLQQELEMFRARGMMPVLAAMKYVVDTLRSNHIVWGVGRGSSVASYVLFIIGVHKIDSVKYMLPISEFFKGE